MAKEMFFIRLNQFLPVDDFTKRMHVKGNAKEIYPCDQGNVGAAVSVLLALIARIDFLSTCHIF